MITYKGQKTVIGKRFIYEGQTVTYMGKIYGDKHLFESAKQEYILTESELEYLDEYKESNIVKDIKNNDKIKDVIIDYTEKELNLLNDLIVGKNKDINTLNDYYQKEIDELMFLNKYDLPKIKNTGISLEAQKSFLTDINRNVSDTGIVSLITNLQDFIASNKGDENNGDIQ